MVQGIELQDLEREAARMQSSWEPKNRGWVRCELSWQDPGKLPAEVVRIGFRDANAEVRLSSSSEDSLPQPTVN